jgi:hypothetical protein
MYCPNRECPDAKESGVASEYVDRFTVCPKCGVQLVPSPPAWTVAALAPSSDADALVPCLTVGDASLLPHIKAVLRAAGVPHLVKNEGVQHLVGWGTAAFGFNPITGPPVVMVERSQLDRAKALLEEVAQASAASITIPTPSRCVHCGRALEAEDGDAALAHCYHCGWPLQSA